MHGFEETGTKAPEEVHDGRPWYALLTRYHWFVLTVAALGGPQLAAAGARAAALGTSLGFRR